MNKTLSPAERLKAAITASAAVGGFDSAVASLTQRVRNDATLLWELWGTYPNHDRHNAVKAAVSAVVGNETKKAISTPVANSGLPSSGGANRLCTDVQYSSVGATKPNDGKGQSPFATHQDCARPVPPKPSIPLHVIAASVTKTAASVLNTFMVNGKPIGEVKAGEARAWANARKRDAVFVDLLTSGLQDAMVIGEYVTSEEAEQRMKRAKEAA